MTATVFDATPCELGEGPLWHPLRHELFWFDILGKRLYWRGATTSGSHAFNRMCSAAGWISDAELLIASETDLFVLNLDTGSERLICPLEADNPDTRSNDGRADPMGGFWIGTMSKTAAPGAGAIYRYAQGELRKVYPGITIPNGICFAPDGRRLYYADTLTSTIMTQTLDAAGWPEGAPTLFVDLTDEGLLPDGSVTDAEGRLWNAQWGASRIACYDAEGGFIGAIDCPARHTSCPAFGGPDMTTLFCTTARELLPPDVIAAEPQNGQTFAAEVTVAGRAEPQVVL